MDNIMHQPGMITLVGVDVHIYRGSNRIHGLPDPAGGRFDAAGDFDRILPTDPSEYPILTTVDRYGRLELGQSSMPGLIAEIDQLLPSAHPGSERNGLIRLRILAQYCIDHDNITLDFVGD